MELQQRPARGETPGDRGILQALAAMERDRGDRAKALAYAERLLALAPDDPAGERLVQELRR